MNRVLEWHAFDEELRRSTDGADFRLEIDERRRIPPIELPGKTILGYSNEVTKAQDRDAGFTLSGFREKYPTASIVQSWRDWRAVVQQLEPNILILLTHTIPRPHKMYVLEIGPPDNMEDEYDSQLPTANFSSEYMFGPNRKEPPPIVLLLGCKTDDASAPLRDVVATFQAYKAAIVLSTSSDMYGPLAGRIADLLLDWLSRLVDNTQTFGDVMLRVRRQAMKEGIPMILCIQAYGDADWKLTKEVVQER